MNLESSMNIIRWNARIWGICGFAFLLFFVGAHFIGEGGQGEWELMSPDDRVAFTFFPLLTMVGLAIGIRKELPGGIVLTGAYVGIAIVRPDLFSSALIVSFVVPGVLNLLSGFMKART